MILLIVRMSFEMPAMIKPEKSRLPRATLVLLNYLGTLPSANAVRDDLERTIKFAEQIRLSASTVKRRSLLAEQPGVTGSYLEDWFFGAREGFTSGFVWSRDKRSL